MAYIQNPLNALSDYLMGLADEQEKNRLERENNERLAEQMAWTREARDRQRLNWAYTDQQRALAAQQREEEAARIKEIGPAQVGDWRTRLLGEKSNPFYNTQMDPENPSLPPYANITQELSLIHI